jgi:diguanylate cyclase (GGDEF)-like protein/PAS domain S-box-containing protein
LRSRGLRIRLLGVALGASVLITAALLAFATFEHRRTGTRAADDAERILLSLEAQRLESLSADLATTSAMLLESAVEAGDSIAIKRIGQTLMANPAVMSTVITDEDGTTLFSDNSPQPATLAAAERRSATRPIGSVDAGATIQVEVGRPGLLAAVTNLREQLMLAERYDFRRWLWVIGLAGIVIALALCAVADVLGRRLERPIVELIRSAERIGAGDYSRPFKITSNDAIADLEVALDRMRQKLRQTTINADYLTTVLNGIDAAVLLIAPSGEITRANDAAVHLLGYPESEIAGKSFSVLLAPNERESFQLHGPEGETRETVITTRSGQTIPVSLSGQALVADDPQLQGTLFVIRNITERKRAERRIRYLARYDALTKIPNRMQFQHMLQQAIARARSNDGDILMLYLDMDRFKEINDTFGHAAGDRTLEVLAERLTHILPREAVVGRLAGDEFALFIEGFADAEDQSERAANLARMVISEVGKAYYVGEQEVFLTASVGIAFCPKDADNVIDLIRNADAAMYHSKQNGGNGFAFYMPHMNAAAVERLMLRSKLRRALERDELMMFYQPKVDLKTGRISGAEALLRWRLPGHGDIPPSQFIPLAEENNMIQVIGEWVLNRVCADYHRFMERVPNPGRVSINLSLKQLRQSNFITRCKSVFRRHDVSPTCFELEITETTLMVDPQRTVKLLNELHAMGLHLSIDDFGTGYSSLSALQQFPIGTLKIDQSFVRDTAIDSDGATIVRTIIDMGKALNVEVIAEGVETEEQLNFLRARGCHYAQGRLFGDAMNSEAFLALLIAQAHGGSKVGKLFANEGVSAQGV